MDKIEKSYHKLIVWQKFRALLLLAYKMTDKLPKSEDFGLKSQMRRAVVSVLSNFVEGYLKKSSKEKLHFMEIAETSLLEFEAQTEICLMLNYINQSEYAELDKTRGAAAYFLYRYRSKISS